LVPVVAPTCAFLFGFVDAALEIPFDYVKR